MDKLRSMMVFEKVVAEGGFAAAARALDLSPAVVTRSITDLEDRLGVRLVQRTTRRMALTTAGEVYLDRVRAILGEIADAEETVHSQAQAMSGALRITALPGIATHLVAPAIARFRQLHPAVTIELHADTLAARGIESSDITLLSDQMKAPAEAVVRRVVETRSILCASPEYLHRRGHPASPAGLLHHDLIVLQLGSMGGGGWQLTDEADPARVEFVRAEPVLTCNDHEAALRSTLEGVGISSQTLPVASPLLRSGRLVRVLAPWVSERHTLLAAFANRRHMPARTRAFLEILVRFATQVQADGVREDAPAAEGARA